MTVQYVTIPILESDADALVAPVNTVGVMGKGLALAFARQFPDLANDYATQCARGRLTIGQLYFWRIPNDEPIIESAVESADESTTKFRRVVCLPTKRHWRHPSQLEYVEIGLQLFVKHYAAFGITRAAFPQLGCGLGGLDWELRVKPLMEKYLAPLPIAITIHLHSTTLPPIVQRALQDSITDIGQLSVVDVRALNTAVMQGILTKDTGGPFPNPKKVWARPGYDFRAEREHALAELRARHGA